MDAKSMGITISKLRKKQKLTQAQLAQKLNISDKTVSRWENGLGYPEITQLPSLAAVFGVTVDYIITGDRKGITIVGNILSDIVKEIDIYPTAGKLAHIKNISRSVGGCAPNTSINLAKIDRSLPVSIIGKIGDDEHGRFILSQLGRYGVDSERVVISKEHTTSFCDVMTTPLGESTFFHTDGANSQFSPDDINLPSIHSAILHVGYVLPLGDFDHEDAEYGTKLTRLLCNAQNRGIKTSLNIMSDSTTYYKEKVMSALKYCDYAILNQNEFNTLCKIPPHTQFDINYIEKMVTTLTKYGIKEKIIVNYDTVSFCFDIPTGNFTFINSLVIPNNMIKSSVGVGDAFCAGCLYGIYNNLEDQSILEFAVSAATCSLFSENSIDGMLNQTEIKQLYEKFR